jgi:hypothetical protein
MVILSPEQRRAIGEAVDQPVPIVDPVTHDAYVLVRADVYARLATIPQPPSHQPNPDIPPLILRSQQAFWQDLPDLLKNKRNRGKWAAYHGTERVALTRSDVDAYQECFRRGLKHEEFYVGRLEADPDGIPPWGTREGDWSLYEATDGSPNEKDIDPSFFEIDDFEPADEDR